MCSGALRLDQHGRLVVIATIADTITFIGHVFVVLDPRPFGLAPEDGRLATARERASARSPYESNSAKHARRERLEVPDDQLDEATAVEAAYAEQRRAPPDLVNIAA